MELIVHEIYRLVDDYYKCDNFQIKEQIISDIIFLSEAYLLYVEKEE
ncbi:MULTISPECIES: hypothetical protein [Bacillaceae]|nr:MULTISPECIES: hypothetical protein [Bacillaceae]MDF2065550.1 hypothetical protein [Bacillus sp. Cr_A10]